MAQPDTWSKDTLKRMADAIRVLSMDAVNAAASGHQGMPMGMADAATVLFSQFMRFDPQDPNWATETALYCPLGMGPCSSTHFCT